MADISNQEVSQTVALSFDDIVFSGRNQEYGAYAIRKRYNKFVIWAFSISFFAIALSVGIPLYNSYNNRNKQKHILENTVQAEMQKMDEEAPPPPPPPPPPPAEIEQQVKFKAPVVVDSVKEVELASIDDLKDVQNEAPPEEVAVVEEKEEVIEKVEEAFWIVEENATFQGGDINSYRIWVQQQIVFPQAAADAGISGKVTVMFSINSKGQVCDVKIARGLHPEIDKEVIRVLMSSPQWSPAKQGGKSVKQNFSLPVVFQLN